MFKTMQELLTRPVEYRSTQCELWNDDYISQQMLRAHLEPNQDGASRRLSFIQQSVDWIQNILAPSVYPQLLDVGCGPGIYAELLAQRGFTVTGVDFSRRSIYYARSSATEKGLHIDYLYQDYLQLAVMRQFDVAIMIYCDYGALSPEKRKVLLGKLYHALRPGGRLILDVFSLAAYERFSEQQSWKISERGGFWSAEPYLELLNRCKYPSNVTLEQFVILSGDQSKSYYIWNSYFSVDSLLTELDAAGFRLVEVFSDVAGRAYDEYSDTLAVIFQK